MSLYNNNYHEQCSLMQCTYNSSSFQAGRDESDDVDDDKVKEDAEALESVRNNCFTLHSDG